DIYCIFSTSKPTTSTLLLTRLDRGEVRLVDKVAEFIPEFAIAGKEDVTIFQLLTHTAGFPSFPLDFPMEQWGDWDAGIGRIFDLARFYQMWLNGGELDGVRVISPATVDLATTNHTGDHGDRLFDLLRVMNRWPHIPANRGLGFWIRGTGIFPSHFGSLASPRTF